jgi:PAS domain S-box-containing protein
VENVNDAIYLRDFEGNIIDVNENACRILGYAREELVGAHLSLIDTPENTRLTPGRRAQLLREGSLVFEGGLVCKDGSIVPVEVSAKVVSHEGEGLIQSFVRNITKRKQAEEALRASEESSRLAMGATGYSVWELDRVNGKFYLDEKMIHSLGYQPGEIDFDLEWWRSSVHPDSLPIIEKSWLAHREGKQEYLEADYQFRSKTGDWKWISSRGKGTQFDDQGQPMRVTGINRDITERKRAEAEKEKLQEQLVQAQKMETVGRLAGGVAHNFNNMLHLILAHCELALDQAIEGSPVRESLLEIEKATRRSADPTRQLLAFARRQTAAPKILDLNDTVTGMLKMLRRLIGEDIDLLWKPGLELWPVKMDPSQIDQILANLAVNSRDAIAGVGQVIIETENSILDEAYCADHAGFVPGEYVLMAFSDSGRGMGKEILEHVFEPFFTTKGVGQGTGLGLATIYGIVKQNDGFINVYSEPGKGTTFMIYLPRHVG